MNIICNYRNKTFANKFLKNNLVSSYIISLEKYNLFTEATYSLEEVIDITKKFKRNNKKVIVDIAKIIHEDELNDLEKDILFLSQNDVDYFLYSDFGIHYILKKNNLIDKALLYSNTYLTNTFDTKIYQEKNGMVVLSNQINVEELVKISNDSYPNQMISAFGLAMIMYTRRPILSNYFEYRCQNYDSKKMNYSLQEEFRDDLYPIVENDNSTKIYDFGYYYLLNELRLVRNNIDIIVSGEMLNNKTYQDVLNLYCAFLKEEIDEETCLMKLQESKVSLNKGAYARKLTLTKGGNQNA